MLYLTIILSQKLSFRTAAERKIEAQCGINNI